MKTVVTLGESLIDMVSLEPGNLESASGFAKAAGGAPANVAACVARLGGRAAFVGMRGSDPFGNFLQQTLAERGVDTQHYIPTDRAKTALAFVSLDETGDRSFAFYRDPSADMLLTPDDVPHEFIASAGILHVGSVSLSAEPCRSATIAAVQRARDAGAFVSYDPNWRPPLWHDIQEGLREAATVLSLCDMVKVNREELNLFLHTTDVSEGAAKLHDLGAKLVFITLDADGCYYSIRHDRQALPISGRIPGHRVQVVDTTGAGDTFVGSILYQLAQYDAGTVPLSEDDVRSWAEFAVAASALVTTKRGGIPALPTRDEVVAFRRG